jgi:hypothetical protein
MRCNKACYIFAKLSLCVLGWAFIGEADSIPWLCLFHYHHASRSSTTTHKFTVSGSQQQQDPLHATDFLSLPEMSPGAETAG